MTFLYGFISFIHLFVQWRFGLSLSFPALSFLFRFTQDSAKLFYQYNPWNSLRNLYILMFFSVKQDIHSRCHSWLSEAFHSVLQLLNGIYPFFHTIFIIFVSLFPIFYLQKYNMLEIMKRQPRANKRLWYQWELHPPLKQAYTT